MQLELVETTHGSAKKTEHILIEGDNSHSLELLSKEYTDGIDVIYIDPPYNTGKKFTYNDKRDGWVDFMEERLLKAKPLLKDDGIVYIQIGDDELANLIILGDKIFGRENRISIMSRITTKGKKRVGKKDYTHFHNNCDYILMYAKDVKAIDWRLGETAEASEYKHVDIKANKRYRRSPVFINTVDITPGKKFAIQAPDGELIHYPKWFDPKYNEGSHSKAGCWRFSQDTFNRLKEEGRIEFRASNQTVLKTIDKDGIVRNSKWTVEVKDYYDPENPNVKSPYNFIIDPQYSNAQATKEFNAEFPSLKGAFDYVKPVSLIKYLIDLAQKPKDITVLDFFAGSGTTGHAVIELNAQDNGTRTSIMCALNDPDDDVDICEEVTYQRIKRVTDKYNKTKYKEGDVGQATMFEDTTKIYANMTSGFDGFPPTLKYYRIKL